MHLETVIFQQRGRPDHVLYEVAAVDQAVDIVVQCLHPDFDASSAELQHPLHFGLAAVIRPGLDA